MGKTPNTVRRARLLAPEQRPNICVRYVCLELREELIEKPEWRAISKLGAELRDEFARFEARMITFEARTAGRRPSS